MSRHIKKSLLVVQKFDPMTLKLTFGPNGNQDIDILYGKDVPGTTATYLRAIRHYDIDGKDYHTIINGFITQEMQAKEKITYLTFNEEAINKELYDRYRNAPKPLHLANEEHEKFLHLIN